MKEPDPNLAKSMDDRLNSIDLGLKMFSIKCRRCEQPGLELTEGYCKTCRPIVIENRLKRYLGREYKDSNGYVRTYVHLEGKVKISYKHREIMRDLLQEQGLELLSTDKVVFKDGDKSNFDPGNLVLTRNGVPAFMLCPHCQEPILLLT